MKADITIICKRHGRVIEIQPQVLLWRKRQARYTALKKELAQMLHAKGWDKAKTQEWLNTPIRALSGRTPRQMMTPMSIGRLHAWAKKWLP